MVYGFQYFNHEDERYREVLAGTVIDWMEQNVEETIEGYEIAPLTQEAIDTAAVDSEIDAGILGVAVGLDYIGDLDLLADGMTTTEQGDIFSSYVEFERIEHTDRGCFLSGACGEHRVTDTLLASVGLGIELEVTYDISFASLTLDDGQRVILRQLIGTQPASVNVSFLAIHQQYGFDVCYERADGRARRAQAMWADGEVLSGDTAEGLYLSLSISSMKSGASDLNAWMEGQ